MESDWIDLELLTTFTLLSRSQTVVISAWPLDSYTHRDNKQDKICQFTLQELNDYLASFSVVARYQQNFTVTGSQEARARSPLHSPHPFLFISFLPYFWRPPQGHCPWCPHLWKRKTPYQTTPVRTTPSQTSTWHLQLHDDELHMSTGALV